MIKRILVCALAGAMWFGMFGTGVAQEPSANSNGGVQNATGPLRMQDRVSREVFHELVTLPQLTIFDNLHLQSRRQQSHADGTSARRNPERLRGKTCKEH